MFKRSLVSRDRAGKSSKPKRSFKDPAKLKSHKLESPPLGSTLMSSIVTVTVSRYGIRSDDPLVGPSLPIIHAK